MICHEQCPALKQVIIAASETDIIVIERGDDFASSFMPVKSSSAARPKRTHSTILERLDHPDVHISWNDARAYCERSQTRLSTEAGGSWPPAANSEWRERLCPHLFC
jgi:formylglycine-generating enzyme required for sulfatase activity